MTVKRRWLWIALFVLATLLLGTLAATYNVVLVRDYHQLLELARSLSRHEQEPPAPWWKLALGTLGFITLLGGLVLFFVRLLREMQLNQTQAEFLASVSHALKTPIATLELSSSLLRSGDLSQEEGQSLWVSHDAELKRLKEQVEALLEAARWESASVSITRTRVQLEEWIQANWTRWMEMLGPHAELKREGAPLECASTLDVRILGLIADNLIENTRKFARGTPRLILRSSFVEPSRPWQRRRWRLEFRDQGWGFEPRDSGRIFRRFVRARVGAPYAIPGTGLGLYLAASAARVLGLRLRGDSPGPGQGATFTLEGRARC